MNKLRGTIQAISGQGSLSIVQIKVQQAMLWAIVTDTPETAAYLRIGQDIQTIFRESEVIIGKGAAPSVSLLNLIPGQIKAIEPGELLTRLWLDTDAGPIISLIMTAVRSSMDLQIGMPITAMIKTNEIMLAK